MPDGKPEHFFKYYLEEERRRKSLELLRINEQELNSGKADHDLIYKIAIELVELRGRGHGDEGAYRCMEDIEPVNLTWTWPNVYPEGKFCLITGVPGTGKSYFTCFMTATITTGAPWPTGSLSRMGSVIMMTCEDDLADTVVPRLVKAGANPKKVHFLEGISKKGGEGVDPFCIENVEILEAKAKELGDLRLVVIDPLDFYLRGGSELYIPNVARASLGPLQLFCAKHKVTALGVAHHAKSKDYSSASAKVAGSYAIVAACRAAWTLTIDPEDRERRIFSPNKTNLSINPLSLAFKIEDGVLAFEKEGFHLDLDAALGLTEEVRVSPNRKKAIDLILSELAEGQRLADDVKDVGEAQGIDRRYLETVSRDLRKKGLIEKQKTGYQGAWEWYLCEAKI